MPRPRGFGKGETGRANIRLDPDTLDFYKRRANEQGVSLSEYLRQLLTHGVTCETVSSIEAKLGQAGDEIAAKVSGAQAAGSMPILLQRALLETHAMLTKIVEAQDIQSVYDSQEIAKAKLARLHSAPPQNPG